MTDSQTVQEVLAVVREPVESDTARLSVAADVLAALPVGVAVGERSGRAGVVLIRADPDTLVVEARCEGLEREVVLWRRYCGELREEFAAYSDSIRTVIEAHSEAVRTRGGAVSPGVWLLAGMLAAAVVLLTRLK